MLLREAHVKQFYNEAIAASPEQLQMLLEKHPKEAEQSQEKMGEYILALVEKKEDIDEKIDLLQKADPETSTNALSAYLNRRNWLGQHKTLDMMMF